MRYAIRRPPARYCTANFPRRWLRTVRISSQSAATGMRGLRPQRWRLRVFTRRREDAKERVSFFSSRLRVSALRRHVIGAVDDEQEDAAVVAHDLAVMCAAVGVMEVALVEVRRSDAAASADDEGVFGAVVIVSAEVRAGSEGHQERCRASGFIDGQLFHRHAGHEAKPAPFVLANGARA